jgi:hypothetical protein
MGERNSDSLSGKQSVDLVKVLMIKTAFDANHISNSLVQVMLLKDQVCSTLFFSRLHPGIHPPTVLSSPVHASHYTQSQQAQAECSLTLTVEFSKRMKQDAMAMRAKIASKA